MFKDIFKSNISYNNEKLELLFQKEKKHYLNKTYTYLLGNIVKTWNSGVVEKSGFLNLMDGETSYLKEEKIGTFSEIKKYVGKEIQSEKIDIIIVQLPGFTADLVEHFFWSKLFTFPNAKVIVKTKM